MWKSTVEPIRTQMTVWRMRIACLYLRLQIYSQNISYILFGYCVNGYANASRYYVSTIYIYIYIYIYCLSYYITKFPVEMCVTCGVSLPHVPLFLKTSFEFCKTRSFTPEMFCTDINHIGLVI